MLTLHLYGAWLRLLARVGDPGRDETGQTTAEYALVILGAAALAGLLLAWAAKSNAITRLFDVTIGQVVKMVKS